MIWKLHFHFSWRAQYLLAKLGVSKEDIDALVNKLKQTKANVEEVVKLANTLLC